MSATNIAVPADDDDDPNDDEQSKNPPPADESSAPRRPRYIPTRDECLAGIAGLNAALAIGFITPSKANSMRANFVAILRSHESSASTGSARVADEDLLKLWRTHPNLVDFFEPLVSAEALDLVMREVRRDAV